MSLMEMSQSITQIGLDTFERNWPKRLKGSRVGLLVHPASVNKRLEHAVNLLVKSKKFTLNALFGPQHGIYGETQDNMIEWEGFRDPHTGLPVFSLYSQTRKPEPSMLKAYRCNGNRPSGCRFSLLYIHMDNGKLHAGMYGDE